MKPWLYDDLVIYDGETYSSALKEGTGLPSAPALVVRRSGKWPRISGLDRPGRQLFLETMLECVSDKAGARRTLLQALNPELEATSRLTVADAIWPGIAPRDLVLATGPWNLQYAGYFAGGGYENWGVDDLTGLAGLVAYGVPTGGWLASPGAGIQIAEATTNLVTNPSFETNTTGWSKYADLETMERSSSHAKFGQYSLRCYESAAAADREYIEYRYAAVTAGETYALSVWTKRTIGATAARAVIWWHTAGDVFIGDSAILWLPSGVYDWTRSAIVVTAPATAAKAVIAIVMDPAAGTEMELFVDGVQLEHKAAPTPYCDGSLGCGHTWSGTAHASTSARTAADLTFDIFVASATGQALGRQGSACGWLVSGTADGGSSATAFALTRDAFQNLMVYQVGADGTWRLSIHSSDRITGVAGVTARVPGTVYFWCATWDLVNNSYALYVYENGTLYSGTATTALEVFSPSGMDFGNNAGAAQCNAELFGYAVFSRVLTAEEVAGIYAGGMDRNARWVDVICEGTKPLSLGGGGSDWGLVAQLAVDGDVRYRSRDGDLHHWPILAASATTTVDNQGDDDAYPVYSIRGMTAKSAGFTYKAFAPVVWKATEGFQNYPILLGPWDTTALVAGGHMQADGDDLRVYVDGAETPRIFGGASGAAGGPNSATTKTWIAMDFEPGVGVLLGTAIGAGDTITTITAAADIGDYPESGMLLLDSEVFVYTGKNLTTKQFTGVTRAAKGTAAADHTTADTIYWIQHEVLLMYGDASLTAPSYDDWYDPCFDLATSTNDSWVYANFGHETELKAGSWVQQQLGIQQGPYPGYATLRNFYTANEGSGLSADWDELGMTAEDASGNGLGQEELRWYLYNPCGLASANFTNGEAYAETDVAYWDGYIESSIDGNGWTEEYDIKATGGVPAAAGGWEAWSRNETLVTGSKYVGLHLGPIASYPVSASQFLEASDCTVGLNTTYSPDHEIGSEQANYPLDCTLTNETTGESITLEYNMTVTGELRIDTDRKVITDMADDSVQMQALTLDEVRRDWLRLQPGVNSLKFDDTGTTSVVIVVEWDRRYFE